MTEPPFPTRRERSLLCPPPLSSSSSSSSHTEPGANSFLPALLVHSPEGNTPFAKIKFADPRSILDTTYKDSLCSKTTHGHILGQPLLSSRGGGVYRDRSRSGHRSRTNFESLSPCCSAELAEISPGSVRRGDHFWSITT